MKAQIKDSQIMPLARKDGLVVKKVNGEMLVYDTERHTAYCLNENAALMWDHCDGRRTIDELSDLFVNSEGLSNDQREQIVRIAIDELAKYHLFKNSIERPETTRSLSRRQMMRVAGIAALIGIPAVTTIIAPTAAQASTCLASGQSCSISAECCSGLCSANTCV